MTSLAASLRTTLNRKLVFYGEVLRATRQVGAFSLSSASVARAIARPLERYPSPRRVLEVGAGTGALTTALVNGLGAGDRLDLCEINAAFAKLLHNEFARAANPRVQVLERDVAALVAAEKYHVIVHSLPLLNFEPELVRRILETLAGLLEPGGTISSWSYWANSTRTLVASRAERRRLQAVMKTIAEFELGFRARSHVIFMNLPPARVHELVAPVSSSS